MSKAPELTDQLRKLFRFGVRMTREGNADAVLIMLDGTPLNWRALKKVAGNDTQVIIAANHKVKEEVAPENEFPFVGLDMQGHTIQDQLVQAVLECVADDYLASGATVAAIYSGFEPGVYDSVSFIKMDERLGRLTVRDLRQLETYVPLDTLKAVVDLAVEIGRDGREGKQVGTLFVVGDHRKVSKFCHPLAFDPFKGYNKVERNLSDPRVREGVKETSLMDGAFIVASDGTIIAGAQYVNAPAGDITLSKGLGTRHFAAAAISRATKAVAVAISESTGTVRLFQNGDVIHKNEQKAISAIPLYRLLSTPLSNLKNRAERLGPQIEAAETVAAVEVVETDAYLEAGALPSQAVPTVCLKVVPKEGTAKEFAGILRQANTPVVARVEADCVMLDLRTVFANQDIELVEAITGHVE